MPLDVDGVDSRADERTELHCIVVPALAREQVKHLLVSARGLKSAERHGAAETLDGRAARGPIVGNAARTSPHRDPVDGSDAGESLRSC